MGVANGTSTPEVYTRAVPLLSVRVERDRPQKRLILPRFCRNVGLITDSNLIESVAGNLHAFFSSPPPVTLQGHIRLCSSQRLYCLLWLWVVAACSSRRGACPPRAHERVHLQAQNQGPTSGIHRDFMHKLVEPTYLMHRSTLNKLGTIIIIHRDISLAQLSFYIVIN